MAQEINLYLGPVIGDGLSPATAWRSALNDLISWPSWFNEAHNDARRTSLTVLYAEPAVHAAVQADGRFTRLAPVVSATAAQLRAHYNTPLTTLFTAPKLVAYRASLESAGIDTAPATAATSLKDVVAWVMRTHALGSLVRHEKHGAMTAILSGAMGATVGSLTAAQIAAARAWFDSHGYDRSWITGATTFRQVVRYLAGRVPAAKVKMHGAELA